MDVASNSANKDGKGSNTSIVINNNQFTSGKDIRLEFRQDGNEVSLYNQKVVQEVRNVKLMHINGKEPLEVLGFSAKYPKKMEIEIRCDGLLQYNSEGKEEECTTEIGLQYSKDGGNTWLPFVYFAGNSGTRQASVTFDGVTSTASISKFKRNKNKTMRFIATYEPDYDTAMAIKNDVLEFRIFKVDEDDDSEKKVRYQKTFYLTKVRTWCYDKTASTSNNNRVLVPQVPMIAEKKALISRLGIQFKVDESFSNIVDELNCELTSKCRVWDTTQQKWTNTLQATSNPSALALHARIGDWRGKYKYNFTASNGYLTDAKKIDLDSYGRFYERCDENITYQDKKGTSYTMKRFSCDGAVVNKVKTSELVNQILSCGRGYNVLQGTKYGVFYEAPIENPVMVLNNQNILEASNQKNFKEEIQGFNVKFIDSTNNFTETTMNVPIVANADLVNGKFEKLELAYQTNPYRAKREALYRGAIRRLRPETFTRKVATEGSLIEIGNLVEIQDDTILVGNGDGAEIKSLINDTDGNCIGIVVDYPFTITDDSQRYGVHIQTTDNYDIKVLKVEVVQNTQGEHSTLTFTDPITGVQPKVGDIVAFGIYNKVCTDTICIGKKRNDNGTFDLSLIPYQSGVYSADEGAIDDYDPKITPPMQNGSDITSGTPASLEELQALRYETSVKIEDIESQIGGGTEPPVAPTISAVAYKDRIELYAGIQNAGGSNAIKKVEYQISTDNFATFETVSTFATEHSFDYISVIGHPECNSARHLIDSSDVEYKVRAKVYNNNTKDNVSEWSSEVPIVAHSSYSTWIPNAPTEVVAVAHKDGVSIKWNANITLGDDVFDITLTKGETVTEILGITGHSYEYLFDRDTDGYPESEDFDNWSVKIKHKNGVSVSAETNSAINTDDYGTWKISNIVVEKTETDRTVMLKLTSVSSYGDTRYRISIKRNTNGDVPADENWYQPDLFADFIASETAYRKGDGGSYEDNYIVIDSRFTQTLPLIGQDNNEIIDTSYLYKIVAFNESGNTCVSDDLSVTAHCTSIRDIVKARADYKELYVQKLSALSADVGLLSQGGFGDFKGWTNFWALSKMLKQDTGLDRDLPEGAFRVGDDNQYIAVVPPHCIFGEEGKPNYINNEDGNDTVIKIKAGNIEMVTRGSSFNGGTYIYDENNGSNRMKLNSNGLQIEALEETVDEQGETVSKWVVMGDITLDQKGNLMITNTGDSNENKPKYGIYTSSTAQIYRFENNLKSESGTNELEGVGTYIDSPFSDNEFGNAFSGELKIPTNRESCCFNNGNVIRVNDRTLLCIEDETIELSSTLTDWETKLGLSAGIFKWEE